MSKNFLDVEKDDIVVVFDEYAHDYLQHRIKVNSIEHDKEYSTETNPDGKICYGTDLDEKVWGDDSITNVTESNFCYIQ